MINKEKMDAIMLELGHPDSLAGTEQLRIGISLYRPGVSMTKELYPAIAKAAGSTTQRVERSMRHSICTAWQRGSFDAQLRYFGCSVDPERGVPTVGEYLARMARICHEN